MSPLTFTLLHSFTFIAIILFRLWISNYEDHQYRRGERGHLRRLNKWAYLKISSHSRWVFIMKTYFSSFNCSEKNCSFFISCFDKRVRDYCHLGVFIKNFNRNRNQDLKRKKKFGKIGIKLQLSWSQSLRIKHFVELFITLMCNLCFVLNEC